MTARYRYTPIHMITRHGQELWKLDIYELLGEDETQLVLGVTFYTEAAAKQALLRYRQRVRQGLPLLGGSPQAATINYSQGEICYE